MMSDCIDWIHAIFRHSDILWYFPLYLCLSDVAIFILCIHVVITFSSYASVCRRLVLYQLLAKCLCKNAFLLHWCWGSRIKVRYSSKSSHTMNHKPKLKTSIDIKHQLIKHQFISLPCQSGSTFCKSMVGGVNDRNWNMTA